MFNTNIWPKSAPLRDIRFEQMNDLDIDSSRSLGSNVVTPMDSQLIYASLLMFMVTYGLPLLLYKIQSFDI